LWLASQVGLVRFDGSSFTLYYPDDKPEMESNIIYLATNDRGDLYFQTDDRNLYKYAGKNSRLLSPVNTAGQKKPSLINARKQFFDFTGFLHNVGPAPESDRRHRIFQDIFQHNENFFVADAGTVYLIDRDSLYFYSGTVLRVLSARAGIGIRYLLMRNRLYLLDGLTVMAVYEGGRQISANSPVTGDLPGSANAFNLYCSGGMTLLLADHRLYRLSPAGEGRLEIQFMANLDFISSISAVEYNAGLDLLLIATPTEGFYFLHRNNFTIGGWPPALRQTLSRYRFGPMALRNGGEILTARLAFRPDGWFRPATDTGAAWQRCLYVDRNDRVWGAMDNIPRKMDPQLRLLSLLPPLDANILAYSEDSAGRLYCLTDHSIWRLESGGFRRLFSSSPEEPNNKCFAPAGSHSFWLATDAGLTLYDDSTGELKTVPELAGKQTRAIHGFPDGSVLVGTYGQGYYYRYHGRWLAMPQDKNNFLVTAHCFLEDRHSNIWISSNKGLFKVPKADMDDYAAGKSHQLYYYYYGRQDGLSTNEFNGDFSSCGLITPGGFVSLLSMNGMVCFYADSLQTDFPHGAINMTHVEIDNLPIEASDTIRPPAGYNNLSLEISSPYLGNRNNLYLEYNLRGLNDDWKEIPADGVIGFSRLAPGTYGLRVRKVNGFGKDNYQYRDWVVIVPPRFYKTMSFLVLLALVAMALLILLVQNRMKLAEKKSEVRLKQQTLSETVKRLEDTVARLESSERALLKTNAQREKLISLVIHDLRSPLRFLTMLAADLFDNQAQLSPADMKERAYLVKKGAQDIYNFSDDFLLWVTSQRDNFSISRRSFQIRPLLQEISDFFHEQVQQRGNRLFFEADGQLSAFSDPHVLITIIRNLVDNANKYTTRGTIGITATKEETGILFAVSDTGRGMNPLQVAAFLGEVNLENLSSGSQLGHKFVLDLSRRLNGELSVESEEQKGTTVLLLLPDVSEPPP
jgi:signal transduction histidine kinase